MASVRTISHINTAYPSYLNSTCPFCNYPIEFLYPGRKRLVKDLENSFTETRYIFRCTNHLCYNFTHPFNPAPKYTLPEKHYSTSVWKWIGREAKIYNMNAAQICQRIKDEFLLNISENTIRNIINEIDGYLTHKIDDETKKIIQQQGKIILSLDGQKPEDGEDALWLFVDLISDRVLDVRLLKTADHKTLHQCVEDILSDYGVEIVGLLSDKQGSIVKMHSEFYSFIPHQYCQFHFLQNVWNFIEVKDSNLQTTLRTVITHLPITTMGKEVTRTLPNIGKVNYRDFFAPIEHDLRKLIKNRTKKFESLRGVKSFERLSEYCSQIHNVISNQDPSHRVTKILTQTVIKLDEILKDQQENFSGITSLFANFKDIQAILNQKGLTRDEHEQNLRNVFEFIWKKIESQRQPLKNIKAKLPHKDMSDIIIQEQWYRLFLSYEPGLHNYYDFPIATRTNSKMEQHFGQEKMKLIQRSGKPNVSSQIRLRGAVELKYLYSSKKEIKSYLNEIDGDYSHQEVKKYLQQLQDQQEVESNRWKSKIGGEKALNALYRTKKETKKK